MRNKKNIVIGILCLTLVFMGIGYSLFSTTLNITGSSQSSGSFDVKITNVELNDKSTGATNTTPAVGNNYAVTETTLSATFNAPGDYITYDITVTNRGSIDAVFQVGVNPQTDTSSAFNMSCNLNEGTELLANGGYKTFQCTMTFDENRTLTSMENIAQGNMTITISAVQKAGYTPPTPTVANECFLSFREGEINDYLISNPNCSANVVIPDNLALGVREVTSMEFDDAKCSQFESALTSLDENYTCTNLKAQFNSIKTNPQVVYNTFLGQLSITTYGEEGLEKHPIKKIGDGVFSGKQITGVTIGEGIETIGLSAFSYNNLTNVTLPSTLRVIETVAFMDNNLTSVTLPSGLQTIGDSAFLNNRITTLNLPSGLITIGISAFADNRLTGTLTIPNSVVTIGDYAFNSAGENRYNQISSLVFESGSHLETIGEFAFEDNIITDTLSIPASVVSIGRGAFVGESNGDDNQITSLVFESGSHLQTIGDSAFRYNAITGTLTIPSSVTSIGNYAFGGSYDGSTNRISSLVFESGSHLQTIGNYAFYYNAITGTLTIPSSVISIGESAFTGSYDGSTNQITSLAFESGSHLQTIGKYAFQYNALTGTLTIPTSVTSIGIYAFYNNSIEELHLGSAITTIGNNAFYMKNSTDLKDVYVDMTESNWNNNVTKGTPIFNGTPTMHYSS